jgi:hypothetical protein
MVDSENGITELQEFFLIHSFLYYELDEAFISDKEFESNCRKLIQLQMQYPEIGRWWKLTHNLDTHFSAEQMGISGRNAYPPAIRMKAYYEAYINESADYEWMPDFNVWCQRRDYA